MMYHTEARELKQKLKEYGFINHLSLYAVIINPETLAPEYRRIEVFMQETPKELDILHIRSFFDSFTVYSTYSIWVFNPKTLEIIQAGSWQQ